jgi:hypothetical protein
VLRKHSILHAITLVAALLVVAAFSAAPASAGEYTVPFCSYSSTHSTASWTHSMTEGAPPNFWINGGCVGNQVYRRFEIWTIPAGASDDWTFDAPTGTYISRLEMSMVADPRSAGALAAIYSWQQDGSRTVTAAAPAGRQLGSASYAFPLAGSKVIKLRNSILCQSDTSCPGLENGFYGNEEYWYGARVHLVDPSLPTFSSITGEGWKVEPVDGQDSIDYAVADTGAGVQEVRLYVDGVLQSSRAAGCVAEQLVPCPATASGSFTLDTTKLSEGQHDVALRVVDGSSNEETKKLAITVRRAPIALDPSSGGAPVAVTNTTLSNAAPAVGDRLHGSRGTWAGNGLSFTHQWMRCAADGAGCAPVPGATAGDYTPTNDDIGHPLQFCVTASNSGGSATSCSAPTQPVLPARPSSSNTPPSSIETAGRATEPAKTPSAPSGSDRGQANGSPAADRVVLTALVNNRSSTMKVRFGKRVPISGRLLSANGAPIANAILNVQSRTAVPGAAAAEAAKVVTGSDGRFTYIAPAGPSRVIRFAYRSYSEDTWFADTSDVQLLVSAGVTIKATPRLVHNRQATVFTGRLLGKPISKQGVVVDLQVFFRNKWRTFGAPRTNSVGRYRFKYRFMAGAATWKFRARVRRETSYPYLEGYSAKTVKVKVVN